MQQPSLHFKGGRDPSAGSCSESLQPPAGGCPLSPWDPLTHPKWHPEGMHWLYTTYFWRSVSEPLTPSLPLLNCVSHTPLQMRLLSMILCQHYVYTCLICIAESFTQALAAHSNIRECLGRKSRPMHPLQSCCNLNNMPLIVCRDGEHMTTVLKSAKCLGVDNNF